MRWLLYLGFFLAFIPAIFFSYRDGAVPVPEEAATMVADEGGGEGEVSGADPSTDRQPLARAAEGPSAGNGEGARWIPLDFEIKDAKGRNSAEILSAWFGREWSKMRPAFEDQLSVVDPFEVSLEFGDPEECIGDLGQAFADEYANTFHARISRTLPGLQPSEESYRIEIARRVVHQWAELPDGAQVDTESSAFGDFCQQLESSMADVQAAGRVLEGQVRQAIFQEFKDVDATHSPPHGWLLLAPLSSPLHPDAGFGLGTFDRNELAIQASSISEKCGYLCASYALDVRSIPWLASAVEAHDSYRSGLHANLRGLAIRIPLRY